MAHTPRRPNWTQLLFLKPRLQGAVSESHCKHNRHSQKKEPNREAGVCQHESTPHMMASALPADIHVYLSDVQPDSFDVQGVLTDAFQDIPALCQGCFLCSVDPRLSCACESVRGHIGGRHTFG